jgi:hypothetical protein
MLHRFSGSFVEVEDRRKSEFGVETHGILASPVAKRVSKGPVRQRDRRSRPPARGGGAAAVRRRGGLKQ